MDTSLKLMSRGTGAIREYLYDQDEHLLWVTDMTPDHRCVSKRWYFLQWNPIERIRLKAMQEEGIRLDGLDID